MAKEKPTGWHKDMTREEYEKRVEQENEEVYRLQKKNNDAFIKRLKGQL